MDTSKVHIANSFKRYGIAFAFLAVILFFVVPAEAQNTKGDKPVSSQGGPLFRLPKFKSKSKRGDRAYTRDISGRRRIRTKDKSSANSVVYKAWNPYKDRKKNKRGERAAAPRGRIYNQSPRGSDRAFTGSRDGTPLKVRSISAQRARQNVYPQNGRYVNSQSTSRKRKQVFDRPASGKRLRNASPSQRQQAASGLGGFISRTIPFIQRGRKNVYWGKFSKGERAVTTDLTGRPLRMRNYRSGGGGVGRSDTLITAGRRPGRDRAGSGKYSAGFSATKKGERAWIGDVSGRRNRRRPGRKGDVAGRFFYPRRFSVSGNGQVAGRPLHKGKNNVSGAPGNNPLPGRGGGSVSGQFKNNNGQPISVRPPGVGANGIGKFRGRFFKAEISPQFSRSGYGYKGNMKGKRNPKGGGSISGKYLNNGGQPVNVRAPGIGANGIGKFRGKFFRDDISPQFSRAGYGFKGNMRGKRPPKGGGSISGQFKNNDGHPISVRPPGVGANGIGKFRGNFYRDEISPQFSRSGYGFSGNIRSRRPKKGGGSVSGRTWNNDRQPIQVRGGAPGFDRAARFKGNFLREEISPRFGRQGYRYSGNIKAREPKHGGGSISGKLWNNDGRAIDVRPPGSFGYGLFSGNIKARKPKKGGGSVSGIPWNNDGHAIDPRPPGSFKYGLFSGNIKAKKPKKGGGSVSGKLWNNDEQPIEVRTPGSSEAKAAGYSGKIHLSGFKKNYVQNPHAHDKSLKKQRPNPNTFVAGELQTKIKQEKYQRKPHGADGSLPGIGPKAGSAKAAEYAHSLKMTWSYKHSPHSHEDALNSVAPPRELRKVVGYSGNLRQRNYTHNPSSNKNALNVLSPGKAYARINDYQGNLKMKKYNGGQLHPDAQYAHGFRNNTKQDRTILMDIKLFWSKLFKKNDTQPAIVKEKERKPRYDKKEKDAWKALFD